MPTTVAVPEWVAKHAPPGLILPGPWKDDGDWGPVSGYKDRVLFIHTAECAEISAAAENVAAWGARERVAASWNVVVDNDSARWCTPYPRTAYAVPGANGWSLHIEQAGRANQTRAQWMDAYSLAMLDRSAHIAAIICRYNPDGRIPLRRLNAAQLRAGMSGIAGHDAGSQAFGGTHYDPGPNFPWSWWMARVKHYDRLLAAAAVIPSKSQERNVQLVKALLGYKLVSPYKGLRGAAVTWSLPVSEVLRGAARYAFAALDQSKRNAEAIARIEKQLEKLEETR